MYSTPGGGWGQGVGEGGAAPADSHTHTHAAQAARALQREHSAVSLTTRMGCNLCTLQKREEHYKLLYEIAQVSGEDGPSDGARAKLLTMEGGGWRGGESCAGSV